VVVTYHKVSEYPNIGYISDTNNNFWKFLKISSFVHEGEQTENMYAH